jgi:hypothetical protein
MSIFVDFFSSYFTPSTMENKLVESLEAARQAFGADDEESGGM